MCGFVRLVDGSKREPTTPLVRLLVEGGVSTELLAVPLRKCRSRYVYVLKISNARPAVLSVLSYLCSHDASFGR